MKVSLAYEFTINSVIVVVVASLGVLFGLIFLQSQELDDELKAEKEYCISVDKGIYPDYKGIYETVCKEKYNK